MPSMVLGNCCQAPLRPTRASRVCEPTSTPQMMSVTVTCLVDATGQSGDCPVVRDTTAAAGPKTALRLRPRGPRAPTAAHRVRWPLSADSELAALISDALHGDQVDT